MESNVVSSAILARILLEFQMGEGGSGGSGGSVDYVNVKRTEFGAKGDGVTDDTLAIQKAINSIVNSGKANTIYLPPGTYKITSTLIVDVSYVSIVSNGATIDASAIKSGSAIHLTGTVSTPGGGPYLQSTTIIEGFKLVGDVASGMTGNVTGIRLHTDGEGMGAGTSHITIRNLNISRFRIGLDFGYRSYLVNVFGTDIYYCAICVNQNSNINDGGEKLNFNGCVFFNSSTAIKIYGSETSFIFQSCSFDYNGIQFDVRSARIFCTNCHVEGGDYTEIPFQIDSDTYFDFDGGWILVTHGLPHSMPYMVNLKSPNSSFRFANGFANNCRTTTNYWATGPGQMILENIHSFEIGTNPLMTSPTHNLLMDGSFEESKIVDNFFIVDDVDRIIHAHIGSNIELSLSTDIARSGTKSLKAHKIYGPFSAAAFKLAVPIPYPGAMLNASLWFNKPGTGSGSFSMQTGWCTIGENENGVPVIKKEMIRGELPFELSSSPSGWLRHQDNDPFRRSPLWATHYMIRFFMTVWDSNGGGAIYFDDIEVQVGG